MQKVRLVVSDDNGVLTTAKRIKVAPGEMEKITLKADKLAAAQGTITVCVEELA